jgi:peptide/nickel transport system substrate-binding protein
MLKLTLALLAAAALPASASDDPGTLNYALSSDVDTLDPDVAYDATSLFVISQMYEGLVDYDGGTLDRFVPRLASVVPTRENGFLSKDGLSYAFPLRSGVKFHDGETMTADDVKYSLLRFMLSTDEGGPSGLILPPLLGRKTVAGPDGRPDPAVFELADKAVSVEGGAVVLRLQRPFAPLLSVLAGFAPVVSKTYTAAHGGWDGRKETWAAHWNRPPRKSALDSTENGTGPFRLESWSRDLKRLLLTRNASYWRSPAPLAAVRITTIEEPRTRRDRLQAGEIDVAQVDPRALPFFQAVPGAQVDSDLPMLALDDILFFNENIAVKDNPWIGSGALDGQGVPPDFFADVSVRRAFAFAFDVDAYVREVFRGAAVRARGPIPTGLPGYKESKQQGMTFSLRESENAFRAAARGAEIWDKGFLLPMAYTEGSSERRLACRQLQDSLAKLNAKFRVDCRAISQSKLLEELGAHRLSAFVFRWIMDYPDSHNAVEPFLSSKGFFGSPLSYNNPRADLMVEQAASETDPAKRRALYGELQALAIYDVPVVFTVETPGAIARRVKIQNWIHHPMQPYGNLYEVMKFK